MNTTAHSVLNLFGSSFKHYISAFIKAFPVLIFFLFSSLIILAYLWPQLAYLPDIAVKDPQILLKIINKWWVIGFAILGFFLGIFLNGVLYVSIAESLMNKQQTFIESCKFIKEKYWQLLIAVISGLVIISLGAILILLLFMLKNSITIILGMIFLFAILPAFGFFSFVPLGVIIDKKKAYDSVLFALRLTYKYWFRVVFATILFLIFSGILKAIFTILVNIVLLLINQSVSLYMIKMLASTFTNFFIFPFLYTLMILLFYDLKLRINMSEKK